MSPFFQFSCIFTIAMIFRGSSGASLVVGKESQGAPGDSEVSQGDDDESLGFVETQQIDHKLKNLKQLVQRQKLLDILTNGDMAYIPRDDSLTNGVQEMKTGGSIEKRKKCYFHAINCW